jgi:hypothetical protein
MSVEDELHEEGPTFRKGREKWGTHRERPRRQGLPTEERRPATHDRRPTTDLPVQILAQATHAGHVSFTNSFRGRYQANVFILMLV